MKLLIPVLMIVLAASAGTARAEPAAFTIETFPIVVVAVRTDGSRINAMIDAYLDVHDEDHANTVCAWMPRVRDAVTSVFSRHPVRAVETRVEFADTDDKVRVAVNKALEADLVASVRLFHGKRTADQIKDDGRIVTCSGGRAYAKTVPKDTREVGDVFDDKVRRGVKKRTGK
jgi:flagellar basal body-associated protein FliL